MIHTRSALPLLALASALTAGACSRTADPVASGPIGPLTTVAGDTASVSLAERVLPLAPIQGPALVVAGGPGTVNVVWQVRSGPCMLARAEARRAPGEIVVWITRGGDPVALCVAGEVVYRYEAHLRDVPAGRYRVRVVEQLGDERPREVGAGEATVTAR